ncbi:uncharacterized protein [Diadema antillarum]|uniref:uncharacterized protein n=1 Tax=Diadema antillarum TaxID=105358 RepID=UPI003A84AE82
MGKHGKCVVCGQKFQAKKKGYKRYSLKSQLGPSFDTDVAAALAKALPDFRPKFREGGHVCDSCFRLLRTTLRRREQLLKTEIEWTNRISQGPHGKQLLKSKSRRKTKKSKQSEVAINFKSKRKLGEVQNLMSDSASGGDGEQVARKRLKLAPTVAVLCKNGGHNNFMKRAIAYLLQYRYHKAISTIIAGSERAKRALRGVLEKEVRKEVFYYCKTAEGISQEPQRDKLFSWQRILKGMESKMPMFYSACYAALDIRKGVDLVQSSAANRKQMIRPRLGLMMLLPLFTRRERKFGGVMHILSLLLQRYGNHEKMVGILHRLGVCKRSTATLTHKAAEMEKTECEELLAWSLHNLAEMREPSRTPRTAKKGQVAKAQMPPDDESLPDDSLDSENEGESEDENMLVEESSDDDDDEAENEDEESDNDHDKEDDEDDDEDEILLNMLCSEESASGEEQEDGGEGEEEEEVEEGENGSKEERVEVDGCVQDIESAAVELHMLMDVYQTLKERT